MNLSVPAQSERVTFCGMTGSGKTTLARALLIQKPNAVIIDTKKDEDWKPLVTGSGGIIKTDPYKRGSGRWVWQPPDAWLTDRAWQEHDLWLLYRQGKRVLYVDELGMLAPNSASFPPALYTIAARGRSAKMGLWGTTQRPHGVPLWLLSEANYTFVFETVLKRDRARIEECCEEALPWETLGENRFLWKYRGPRGRQNVVGPTYLAKEHLV